MDEMKEKVEKFRQKIKVRNSLEYFASLFIVVITGNAFSRAENVWAKVFIIELILAAIGISIYIFLKASNLPQQEGEPLKNYQRKQIERQIEIGRTAWLWYIFPIFIGVTGIYFSLEKITHWGIIGFVPFVTVFGAVGWFNIWSARKLRKELEELA